MKNTVRICLKKIYPDEIFNNIKTILHLSGCISKEFAHIMNSFFNLVTLENTKRLRYPE